MVARRTLSRITKVSAFAHTEDHFREKTLHGGIVTLLGAFLAFILFISEVKRCMMVTVEQQMEVDVYRTDRMKVTFDVTFPALPCQAIRLDIGDVSGRFQTEGGVKLAHNGEIHKWQLDRNGAKIGVTEYVPPIDPAFDNPFIIMLDEHDMSDVRDAIHNHEGCNILGWLEVQRLAGNIHFAVRPSAMIALDEGEDIVRALMERHGELHGHTDHPEAGLLNVSHVINTLRFGPVFPGQVHPLEGTARIDRKATGIDKYFIKVIPTEWRSLWGRKLATNQYSVTEYYTRIPLNAQVLPGMYLLYDTSPILVRLQMRRKGLLHLLVRICAVVGGVWAVTRAMDKVVHRIVVGIRKITAVGAAP